MFSYNILHLDSVEKLRSPLTPPKRKEGQKQRERERIAMRIMKNFGSFGSWETYFSNAFSPVQIPITDAPNSQAPSICNSISFYTAMLTSVAMQILLGYLLFLCQAQCHVKELWTSQGWGADIGSHRAAGSEEFNVSFMVLISQHIFLSDTETLVKNFQGNIKCFFSSAINCISSLLEPLRSAHTQT